MSKADLVRLWNLARTEIRFLLLGTLFLVLSSGTSLFYPQAVKWIVDEAIAPKDASKLREFCFVLLVVTLVQGLAAGIRYWYFTLAGERIVLRLRNQLFASLVKQDVDFFDRSSTGDLMSRLSADTASIQNAVSVNFSMLARNLAQVIGALTLLFYTAPKLAAITLALVPPIAIGVAIVGRKLRKLSRQTQDRLADASAIAEDAFQGIRTVKSFVREIFEMQRYSDALKTFLSSTRTKINLITGFLIVLSFVAALGLAAMVWLGGAAVIEGGLSIGELTSFLLYLLMLSIAVGTLAGLWTDFVSAIGATGRVFELIEREPKIEISTASESPLIRGEIEFQNISFAYSSRKDLSVIRDLSLKINPGEIVAVVGPSGAGKSTLTSLLLRFYDPDSGKILIDKHDLKSISIKGLRSSIGVVSQDVFLRSASIEENIRYGNIDATQDQFLKAARESFVDEFVTRFPGGYATLVGERGIQLSGGQKQRVAIARAFLKNPSILILDEATSSLDAEGEFQIRQALQTLMKGRTTWIIAHRLSTVRMAHRILVLEHGRLVQEGSHAALMAETNGLYSRLVERQLLMDANEANSMPT